MEYTTKPDNKNSSSKLKAFTHNKKKLTICIASIVILIIAIVVLCMFGCNKQAKTVNDFKSYAEAQGCKVDNDDAKKILGNSMPKIDANKTSSALKGDYKKQSSNFEGYVFFECENTDQAKEAVNNVNDQFANNKAYSSSVKTETELKEQHNYSELAFTMYDKVYMKLFRVDGTILMGFGVPETKDNVDKFMQGFGY